MIGILKGKFDYLIIDSTPIGLVTDSQLLGPYADTTMYIVRHNLTPKVYLRLINDLYQHKKFNNMSIVFNGLKRRGFSFLNYGYSYGYGSGYGVDGNGYYSSDNGNNGWRNGWGLLWKAKKFFKKR
jgi:hypothetical protein